MRFQTLKIIAIAGTISAKWKVWAWFSVSHCVEIYEREWPGKWPPKVGDTFTVRIEE